MEPTALKVPVFTLGDRLRKSREIIGLTQTDVANSLGIGRRSVSRYEEGMAEPKRAILMAWSAVTGVPLEWLESGEIPDISLVIAGYHPALAA